MSQYAEFKLKPISDLILNSATGNDRINDYDLIQPCSRSVIFMKKFPTCRVEIVVTEEINKEIKK
jgi:hypothetical protein